MDTTDADTSQMTQMITHDCQEVHTTLLVIHSISSYEIMTWPVLLKAVRMPPRAVRAPHEHRLEPSGCCP